MKNVVCPISGEKVLVNIPRITALLVLSFMGLYLLSNQALIVGILIVDFFIRGFLKTKFSPLAFIAKNVHGLFLWGNEKSVNKAPKIFAARLGFVFTSLILVLHVVGLHHMGVVVSGLLVLFAGLECIINFCVGCWVFTLFVHPFYSKN